MYNPTKTIIKIEHLIAARKLNKALSALHRLLDYFFCEPLTVGTILGSEKLDEFCQEIGRLNLSKLNQNYSNKKMNNLTVYIASKIQVSGGHTAALMDVIRLSPDVQSIVIVTNVCGITKKDAVTKKFSKLINTTIEFVPKGNYLSKLTWLQNRLMELSPNSVWLFNHHQDSVAVAAVQPPPQFNYKLKYFHHGDDRLCLGARIHYAEHFDPIPIVFHICYKELPITNVKYLPLTTLDQGIKPKSALQKSQIITCTAGGFNKLEIDYFVRYEDLVPKIIETTRGVHFHFGRLTLLALNRIQKGLLQRKIPNKSFVYIPYVSSIWEALNKHNVNLYIASFPYGGGKTLVEVMGAGIPIIIHSHAVHQMIGGADMAYAGAMIWEQPEELLDFLKNINPIYLENHSTLSRQWYELFHKEEIAKQILNNHDSNLNVPNIRDNFKPDPCMAACLASQSVTLKGVFKRTLFRKIRQFQALIGRVFC